MGNSKAKVPYLEGIRGLAALLVLLHHFGLAFYSAYFTHDPVASHLNGLEISYGQSLLSVLSNGNFCVYVFFVLSGFVLSRRYFQTNDFAIIVSAAQRRFVRLYVPVAATILLSFVLLQAGLYYNIPAATVTRSEWWLGSMWTFPDPFLKMVRSLLYGTMFMGDSSFDTTLSSMSIEFYGSLFVFAFLALTHNTRNKPTLLLVVFLYGFFTHDLYTATFVLGITLNYIEQKSGHLDKTIAGIFAVVLLLVGLVLGSFPTNGMTEGSVFEATPPAMLGYRMWFHSIGAFFLVSAFVLSPLLQRVISLRLFAFLGYVSFFLYLLHPLIIGSFSCFFFLKFSESMDYNSAVAIVFVLTVAFCIPLSWLMTKYIDEPGIKLARRIYERFSKCMVGVSK